MELIKDTRDRIFAAANSLFEHADRAAFPTVDAVRKMAKVNMNDANTGMKEWRRAQTAQAAPVGTQVPEAVQRASVAALATLWHEAQELANESLRAAQAGWDAERIEGDILNKQMADAYEIQAAELNAAQGEITKMRVDAGLLAASVEDRLVELGELKLKLAAATAATETADARAVEIERRATELRTELDHAHQEAAKARAELTGIRRTHVDEVAALRAELLASQAKAESMAAKAATTADVFRAELATLKARADAADQTYQEQRKQMESEAQRTAELLAAAQAGQNHAQIDAAALRGQIDTLKEQNAKIIQSLKTKGRGIKLLGAK